MRFYFTIILLALFSGCAGVSVNESYYPYIYAQDKAPTQAARIVIASNNFGVPSREYLQHYEERVDNVLKKALQAQGHTIVSSRLYEAAYDAAVREFGSPYNSSTGKLDSVRLGEVLGHTFRSLSDSASADIVVFTDILEKQTSVIRNESKRFTRFDGVQRKMKIQGAGSGVDQNFDWNANVAVASLALNAFNIDGSRILHSMGGLDNADAINTRKNQFSRSRSIMKDDEYIEEAVALALHPWVFSALYKEPSPAATE